MQNFSAKSQIEFVFALKETAQSELKVRSYLTETLILSVKWAQSRN